MAKKKASKPTRKPSKANMTIKTKAPSNPQDWKRKPIVFQVRGSLAWKGWVDRLAKHCGFTTIADMLGVALRLLARQHEFKEEPPER